MSFLDAFPHQTFPRQYFRRALERSRLSHAYLFLGPEDAAKERFALELAKAIFCKEGSPCGSCPSCRSIEHGNHAGVSVYAPEEGRRAIDVDTVRAVCERSHYRRDHTFIAILEGVDRMTAPAANALLKTLEEPAGDFVLILTAPSAGALLPTIVSRCHRLHFTAAAGPLAPKTELAAEFAALLGPSFHSRHDARQVLADLVPGADSARARMRELLGALLRHNRQAMEQAMVEVEVPSGELDCLLEYQALLLELARSLEGNVSADLVFEKLLEASCG